MKTYKCTCCHQTYKLEEESKYIIKLCIDCGAPLVEIVKENSWKSLSQEQDNI